ncbi:hypothetical protein LEP1GSC202_2367 [Leptospira yanagawae serovar Saopaulo str. Sao Paulo = ATCC 700523]|uniref:Uncharacterized protein n=1 Tax=Leptospira yanagawae serovar Saopaulo str. Sao Paulo = ATCC 700523 TaxID=1249483 RepID=A0A5E8HA53_9LEPT|nr:hypothetical protein LEP1GSC202_2367 [Leptospira yanagawae serovar Saopaulo str. Sao Paulo = ATCC 700523]
MLWIQIWNSLRHAWRRESISPELGVEFRIPNHYRNKWIKVFFCKKKLGFLEKKMCLLPQGNNFFFQKVEST